MPMEGGPQPRRGRGREEGRGGKRKRRRGVRGGMIEEGGVLSKMGETGGRRKGREEGYTGLIDSIVLFLFFSFLFLFLDWLLYTQKK